MADRLRVLLDSPTGRRLRMQAQAFLTWWREGLLLLVPERWRGLVGGGPARLILKAQGAQVTVAWHERDETRHLGQYAVSDEQDSEIIEAEARALLPADLELRNGVLELHLSEQDVLRKTLEFPLEAEQNLRQVLGYQMDRQTPFTASEVYYDGVVTRRDPGRHRMQVELVVVPRQVLDPWLRHVRDVWGREPDRVTVVGMERDADLLANDRQARPVSPARRWMLGGVAATVLLLVGAAVATPLVQKGLMLSRLEADLAAARQDAASVLAKRDALEQAQQELTSLIQRRQARPSVLAILEELSEILPDDTWLQHLEIEAKKVRLRGQSDNAAALVELVETSDLLHDARFMSSLTRNQRTGKDRFHLEARVAAGAGNEDER